MRIEIRSRNLESGYEGKFPNLRLGKPESGLGKTGSFKILRAMA